MQNMAAQIMAKLMLLAVPNRAPMFQVLPHASLVNVLMDDQAILR
jgi:hypothetical protein